MSRNDDLHRDAAIVKLRKKIELSYITYGSSTHGFASVIQRLLSASRIGRASIACPRPIRIDFKKHRLLDHQNYAGRSAQWDDAARCQPYAWPYFKLGAANVIIKFGAMKTQLEPVYSLGNSP